MLYGFCIAYLLGFRLGFWCRFRKQSKLFFGLLSVFGIHRRNQDGRQDAGIIEYNDSIVQVYTRSDREINPKTHGGNRKYPGRAELPSPPPNKEKRRKKYAKVLDKQNCV